MSKEISRTLNLEPLPERVYETEIAPPEDSENDYEYARTNIMSAIEVGQKALEDMAEVARQSESPRAYEVTTQLIKTLVDSNKDLLELAKKRNELKQATNKSENQNNVTNNNLFVTPTELLNMLRQNES
jgi:hypothetical protein